MGRFAPCHCSDFSPSPSGVPAEQVGQSHTYSLGLLARRIMRLAGVVAGAAAVVGCGPNGAETASPSERFTAPDSVRIGPQGAEGQFAVDCAFDQFLADDPIVHPDAAGASHLHQFFGAVGVHASSRYAELVSGETTCEQRLDTASYWTPVLLDPEFEPIEPLMATAYYRVAEGVDPGVVVPYPADFMAVAGDHTAIEPQPLSVVAWSCDTGSVRSATPPDCTAGTTLRLMITFEDCWDGEHLRSPIVSEPARHVAYSAAGACPDTHPVHIPQLQLAVMFPAIPPEDLSLSSGSILSGHADFWNAWQQDKLEREVTSCLHLNLPCKITG